VIIVTYNSAKYIEDTLDSIRQQTYAAIELIVTDDASTDDTYKICTAWLEENAERFVSAKFLKMPVNGGISANIENGVNGSSGKWIKPLAGDDLLTADALKEFHRFAEQNKFDCVISDMKSLQNGKLADYTFHRKTRDIFFKKDIAGKYRYFLQNPFFLNAPSGFYSSSVLKTVKPFYKKYRLLEDQPLFLSLLRNGIDIGYLRKPMVIYRLHDQSMTGKFNKDLYTALYDCYLEFRKPYMGNSIKEIMLKAAWEGHYQTVIHKYNNPSIADKLKNKLFQKTILLLTR
jgi:alpha-1,3-rhamnosyltransferase